MLLKNGLDDNQDLGNLIPTSYTLNLPPPLRRSCEWRSDPSHAPPLEGVGVKDAGAHEVQRQDSRKCTRNCSSEGKEGVSDQDWWPRLHWGWDEQISRKHSVCYCGDSSTGNEHHPKTISQKIGILMSVLNRTCRWLKKFCVSSLKTVQS